MQGWQCIVDPQHDFAARSAPDADNNTDLIRCLAGERSADARSDFGHAAVLFGAAQRGCAALKGNVDKLHGHAKPLQFLAQEGRLCLLGSQRGEQSCSCGHHLTLDRAGSHARDDLTRRNQRKQDGRHSQQHACGHDLAPLDVEFAGVVHDQYRYGLGVPVGQRGG